MAAKLKSLYLICVGCRMCLSNWITKQYILQNLQCWIHFVLMALTFSEYSLSFFRLNQRQKVEQTKEKIYLF